ncbi:AAA family ATPase [Streptomyces goshikiensis]|uniref:AAA family ATPase n=1 Tax=Streptomyces goshikiensis TaxID=1942 RepID=UPI003684F5F7
MIVALGGLPLTGKSTLARALADALSGVLIDSTALRQVLFPHLVEAPPEVADWLYESVLKAAAWNLDTAPPGTVVVLDGRALTRSRDVQSLHRFASSLGHRLFIVECVCPDEVARVRAGGASVSLASLGSAKGADPIAEPKVVVDTRRPVEHCVTVVVDAVTCVFEDAVNPAPTC